MPPKNKIEISKLSMPLWAKENTSVWVKRMDKLGVYATDYESAIIKSIDQEEKKINVTFTKKNVKDLPDSLFCDEVLQRGLEVQDIDDLVNIQPLNEAELFASLAHRYNNDDVYCYCGPTLIFVNPYTDIPKQSDPELLKIFKEYALKGGRPSKLPHIWNTTGRAFHQLFENDIKQAICISGESGAGKTYGTRLCMSFLTSLSRDEIKEPNVEEEVSVSIEELIEASNPILESFGNAKTIKNDNSSRFGKYFVMSVDMRTKKILGGSIQNYLLEKSRVTMQALKERNYHIFYQMLRFMDSISLEKYKLKDPNDAEVRLEEFNYLKMSKCFVCKKDEDEINYKLLVESFKTLAFSTEEIEAIWKIVSIVLNLGNVDIDDSNLTEANPCSIKPSKFFERVCELLEVDKKTFTQAACVRSMRGIINQDIPRKFNDCVMIIESLAKDLFNNLFNWIVRKLNVSLKPKINTSCNTIGLLDIFGFEDFEINSLEQFCINYTNEKLQGLYNSHVFDAEALIFDEEGLKQYTQLIDHPGNVDIILLMDNQGRGVFQLIDQSVAMSQNKDEEDGRRLIENILKMNKGSKVLFEKRLKRNIFGIKHTAKHVEYTADSFVRKNRDDFPDEMKELLSQANKVILRIFEVKLFDDEEIAEKKKDNSEKYLGYKFRIEMKTLMEELIESECNFIRCIKPNETGTPHLWDPERVVTQIRYLGILETIEIRVKSFPIRLKYKKFYEKYQDLDEISNERKFKFLKLEEMDPNWKQLCENIKQSVFKNLKDDLLNGHTKIFMSLSKESELQNRLDEKQKLKKEGLNNLHNLFKVFNYADETEIYRKKMLRVKSMSSNIMNIWNSKIEYMKFKDFLDIQRKLQMIYKISTCKRSLRLMKHSVCVIGRTFKMYKIRQQLFNAKRVIVAVNNCKKKILFRKFIIRARKCRKIVNEVFDQAWIVIEEKERISSAKTLQRIWRGFSTRIDSNEEFGRLRTLMYSI